jgi:hypothetical protein
VSADEIAAEKLTLRQAEAAFDEREPTAGELYERCVHAAACARLCRMHADEVADGWIDCLGCEEYDE